MKLENDFKTVCLSCKTKYTKDINLFDYCSNCKSKELSELETAYIVSWSYYSYDSLTKVKYPKDDTDALNNFIDEITHNLGGEVVLSEDDIKSLIKDYEKLKNEDAEVINGSEDEV